MGCSKTTPSFLLLFLMTLLICPQGGQSARILSLNFFSSKSHKIVLEPLLLKLAERGHQVTIVDPIKASKETPNVRNIESISFESIMDENKAPNFFELKTSAVGKYMGFLMNPFLFITPMMDNICRRSYALPQVQEIMKEEFNLIIFASAFNDCLYGLVHKFNVPVVLFSQITIFPWMAATMGTPTPPSFVPSPLGGYSDKMTFFERIGNFMDILYAKVVKDYYYNPKMEQVYREFVDPNLPSISEIEANASLVLCNSHISFTKPKPLMPDIIDVGGMHMKKSKPLSKDLEEFVNGGKDGFILFSMGSGLKASTMPEKYRKMFLNTFAKLKQRVLWKWETEQMDDLPSNVKLSKWLPQQDVLGHKKLKLFITHGGHGSITEAIYAGVPLIGIPMFGDQPANMEQASTLGFAIPLELSDVTEEILGDAINRILTDPTYREKAKTLSEIYHDQKDHPLDRAVYWVEYVLRHAGAPHLRSAARDLSTIQYYSLDVMATLVVVLGLIGYIDFFIVRALYRKCCGAKSHQKKSTDKAKKHL